MLIGEPYFTTHQVQVQDGFILGADGIPQEGAFFSQQDRYAQMSIGS